MHSGDTTLSMVVSTNKKYIQYLSSKTQIFITQVGPTFLG